MARHLTLDERFTIANMLSQRASFKAIARETGKDCTTISKEVRSHRVFKNSGAVGKAFNACIRRYECDHRSLCPGCHRNRFCWSCKKCNSACPDFKQEFCKKLNSAPYVCNGCPERNQCTLQKCFYDAVSAQKEYRQVLSESREGISLSETEIQRIDSLVSPLLRKGQSFHHIYENNKDALMISERTLYRLIDYNLFEARNIDMPRKVRYSRRRHKKHVKVDAQCRIGRTYQDYQKFLQLHPDLPITEIDSVEGRKGGKVLLTIHFVQAEFMLAFLRDSNDARSVTEIFERLYLELRPDRFMELMPVLLGDNGSEFSNPAALEFDCQGNRRTHVFYCDAGAPYQKGSAERNHELLRYIVPKGNSFDQYNQKEINAMMNHINSYSRKSLGGKCPYEMFSFLYGEEILQLLDCKRIAPNDVTLNTSVFDRGCF